MPPVNRLAPQPANSFAEYGPYGPVTSDPAASAAYQQQLVSGLGSGLANQLRGMYQTVRHAATSRPIDDIRGALASLAALYDDPMQALQALREMRQRAMSGPQGLGQVLGELAPRPRQRGAPNAMRVTESAKDLADLWHGSPNPPFDRFDPAVRGEFSRNPALGAGHYIGDKGYAELFAPPEGSLTKWAPSVKKSLYFDDSGFAPNTPRANAANRQAFQAVKKVDPELAYRVFKFDKGRIVAIHGKKLMTDAEGRPYIDRSDLYRAMDIAGIDSVADVVPGKGVHQMMVRDPANLTRVK